MYFSPSTLLRWNLCSSGFDCDDEEDLLLLLSFYEEARASQTGPPIHSRYRKDYVRGLSPEARRLRDRRIPRVSLADPSSSAWEHLYQSLNDQALITATGLDHAVFDDLLANFQAIYDNHTIDKETGEVRERAAASKGGRPRLLDAAGCLGLTLMWTRTRGASWGLAMLFGLTGTPTSLWVRFGRRVLLDVLKAEPDGQIRLPSGDLLERFVAAIAAKHPILGGERVWAGMDGLKLYLQASGDDAIQEQYYNGWTCDHYVTNLFLFAPDGTICSRVINAPGTFHDSTMAQLGEPDLYSLIEAQYEKFDVKVCVDSAFASKQSPSMIKSAQTVAFAEGAYDTLVISEATAMRQSAEWGMRGLQGSFPRLKDRFIYEERGERKIMIDMITRLYNFRARRVGMNQIQSVYMPWLDKSATEQFGYHD